MSFKKYFNFTILVILLFSAGCATIPREELALPIFNISGKEYVSLKGLCELKGIDWQWDIFGGALSLRKDDLEARILVGTSLCQINANISRINSAPVFYKGFLVVPISFNQEVISKLIKLKPVKEKEPEFLAIYPVNKVVIDAGHGGKDPGAIGRYGLREKDVTLDVAKRLRNELEQRGIEVIMTRRDDKFISLSRRSQIANSSDADLFISIHANASRARRIQGFEIYYLREFTDSSIKKLAAERESGYLFNSLTMERSSRTLKEILMDMIYTENRSRAITLARCISSSTAKEMSLKNRGIKGANFFVLKNTHIPAILIEIGFVSNADEERYLKNSFFRQQLAESLASGLLNFQKICKIR